MKWDKIGLFAGGVLFGTAGVKILSSKDAKNVYAHTAAAALRVKDCVMKGVDKVQESAADIVTTAKDINEERAAKEDVIIEDAAEETSEAAAEEEADA